MYGKNNLEMAAIDMIMDTALDMFDPFVRAVFTKDEKEKVSYSSFQRLVTEHIYWTLPCCRRLDVLRNIVAL